MSRIFSSLAVRNYRLFFTGQIISNTGAWMQRVAQDWLVLELTAGSGLALGITTGLQFLPTLLFGLYAGVLADRYSKRLLLLITQAAMSLCALALGVLVVSGSAHVWHVYLLATLLGLATALDNPTRQAFVVEMVGREHVPNAVSLNSAVFNGSRIVGPAVAGVLINVFNTGIVFLINGVTYWAVIAGLLMMRDSELVRGEVLERGRGQLREGLAYVRARADLLLPIVLVAVVGTFGMNFQITTALMAREEFHRGAGSFGLATTALAVGSLTGALFAARRRGAPRQALLIGAGVAFGIFECLAAIMPTYGLFMLLLIPTGMCMITFGMAANSTLQLGSASHMRGRVMALYTFVFIGGAPLASPLVGWVAELWGARWSILLGGLISLAATAGAGALLVHRQKLRVRAHILPRPHLHVQPALASTSGAARMDTKVLTDISAG